MPRQRIMMRQSTFMDAMELEFEMTYGFQPLAGRRQRKHGGEGAVAGPFVEREDEHGHLTYHRVKSSPAGYPIQPA